MSLTHPPKQPPQNGRAVDRFIGGAKTNGAEPKEITVSVRIPPADLVRIDQLVTSSRVRSSRQAWIMDAIYAKLDAAEK
jgi:hypothetical protein